MGCVRNVQCSKLVETAGTKFSRVNPPLSSSENCEKICLNVRTWSAAKDDMFVCVEAELAKIQGAHTPLYRSLYAMATPIVAAHAQLMESTIIT